MPERRDSNVIDFQAAQRRLPRPSHQEPSLSGRAAVIDFQDAQRRLRGPDQEEPSPSEQEILKAYDRYTQITRAVGDYVLTSRALWEQLRAAYRAVRAVAAVIWQHERHGSRLPYRAQLMTAQRTILERHRELYRAFATATPDAADFLRSAVQQHGIMSFTERDTYSDRAHGIAARRFRLFAYYALLIQSWQVLRDSVHCATADIQQQHERIRLLQDLIIALLTGKNMRRISTASERKAVHNQIRALASRNNITVVAPWGDGTYGVYVLSHKDPVWSLVFREPSATIAIPASPLVQKITSLREEASALFAGMRTLFMPEQKSLALIAAPSGDAMVAPQELATAVHSDGGDGMWRITAAPHAEGQHDQSGQDRLQEEGDALLQTWGVATALKADDAGFVRAVHRLLASTLTYYSTPDLQQRGSRVPPQALAAAVARALQHPSS